MTAAAGRAAKGAPAAPRRAAAQVHSVDSTVHRPWQGPEWTLAVACTTLKGGRTDWLVEKATELGARALLPLVTQRSQVG